MISYLIHCRSFWKTKSFRRSPSAKLLRLQGSAKEVSILSSQTEIPPFTRMAMIFQACRNASTEYLKSGEKSGVGAPEKALLHQKYMNHLISEFKPVLAEIIQQAIEAGEIHFDKPEVLAEIVLIVLTVKMDNTIIPSTKENIEETIEGLVALLEKGTDNPPGSLNFLMA